MNDFFGIVEAFYSRFILRDVLAKITPGAILLSAVIIDVIGFENAKNTAKDMLFLFSFFFISISWVLGFAIQGLAEKIELIKYHVDDEAEQRYKKYLKLKEDKNNKDVERYVVIKETCGNTYVSILLTIIYLLSDWITDFVSDFFITHSISFSISQFLNIVPELAIALGSAYYLRYMHFEHVKRQDKMVINVLAEKEIS